METSLNQIFKLISSGWHWDKVLEVVFRETSVFKPLDLVHQAVVQRAAKRRLRNFLKLSVKEVLGDNVVNLDPEIAPNQGVTR